MEDLYGGGLISLCLFLLESKTPRETDQNLLREYSISSETFITAITILMKKALLPKYFGETKKATLQGMDDVHLINPVRE